MDPASPKSPRRWGRVAGVAVAVFTAFGAFAYVVYGGGDLQTRGRPTPPARGSGAPVAAEVAESEILFGDLHVHTTFSADAFLRSMPIAGGTGLHPPADACDYARYCSGLDFFALTDHAETITPRLWAETKQAIRECNAISEGGSGLVAFTGFEWTQVGPTPETHYGHKNVVFRDADERHLPARPIASTGLGQQLRTAANMPGMWWRGPLVPIADFPNRERYLDLYEFLQENAGVPACPSGVDTRELPVGCRETASTPHELFEKLDQWGFEALVIPHGTTWGFYTPPGYAWDKQLAAAEDDPERQRLIEVFSGHGSSEEHRAFRDVVVGADGTRACAPPSEGYEPCCVRAGELIRRRCADPASAACEARVREAEQAYADAGAAGHLTVPWATVEDWGNCGQCTDCFDPAFSYRPGGSVQYIMARGGFEEATPRHHTFGFIASSDNHSARPGTGYKEIARREFTEAAGPIDATWQRRTLGDLPPPGDRARAMTMDDVQSEPAFRQVHLERQASFFLTGGLVAVHATARTRDAIWEALEARRVYGTSGDRILLWFDLVDEAGERHPMGSELARGTAPAFEVRALGPLVQQPGCPSWVSESLGDERLEALCLGECHHPGDARRPMQRIEVVRVRRQMREDEAIETLIEDPYLVIPCQDTGTGCTVRFEDPAFASDARDVLYYVRAIETPSPAVNAGGLRCDEEGHCRPCYGDYRTPRSDDCLSPNEERAWSSPIFLRFVPGDASTPEAPP